MIIDVHSHVFAFSKLKWRPEFTSFLSPQQQTAGYVWDFEQSDRVPIEMYSSNAAKGLPGHDQIKEFEDNEADNLKGVTGFDCGFMGLDVDYK